MKHFLLSASEMWPIAVGYGACIASDRITVHGRGVGYMYREAPDRPPDSGWRFFSGDESQAYADEASNFEIYDVNTIANYDEGVVPFLSAPFGSAFERDDRGEFREVPMPVDPGSH